MFSYSICLLVHDAASLCSLWIGIKRQVCFHWRLSSSNLWKSEAWDLPRPFLSIVLRKRLSIKAQRKVYCFCHLCHVLQLRQSAQKRKILENHFIITTIVVDRFVFESHILMHRTVFFIYWETVWPVTQACSQHNVNTNWPEWKSIYSKQNMIYSSKYFLGNWDEYCVYFAIKNATANVDFLVLKSISD